MSRITVKGHQGAKFPKQFILLINRPQDVDLLIGLHEKALTKSDLCICFWLAKGCVKRYPEILDRLGESKAVVGQIVSHIGLWRILGKLLKIDAFMSTVETTASPNKLPYIITRLANRVRVPTYTLQHGFETAGLTYYDAVYGPEVKFAAKTVLTWGRVDELPAWVAKETRDKAVAVGYPVTFTARGNFSFAEPADKRPIIGIFDNLHWYRYSESYVESFLCHMEEVARQRSEMRFILRSHPAAIRHRSRELSDRLRSMTNIELAEIIGDVELQMATLWLLSHALGVITTPSTIAFDSALAGVPVAVTGYGINLDSYSPLTTLQDLGDWQRFLGQITEPPEYQQLKLAGMRFLDRVLVPGDAASRILNMMAE